MLSPSARRSFGCLNLLVRLRRQSCDNPLKPQLSHLLVPDRQNNAILGGWGLLGPGRRRAEQEDGSR